MDLVVLYLGITVIGYFVGSKLKKKGKRLTWTSKVQFVSIILLVFMMGGRIGADESVIESLGTIGIVAFVLTIFTFVGSVLATFGARKLLGIDREGGKK